MRNEYKITNRDIEFIIESNKIEGILEFPSMEQIEEYKRFMSLATVEISDLEQFLRINQRNAILRNKPGINVVVGQYLPPYGGPCIEKKLKELLRKIIEHKLNPYEAHVEYESLHPFTDGNGRSGRMLYRWHQYQLDGEMFLGFLHQWYYQSLDNTRKEKE